MKNFVELGDNRYRQDFLKTALEGSLSVISVALTSHCNLSCKMCGVWKRREHGIEYERVLSLLGEARSLGATRFGAGGGEAFLREDVTDILAYAERIGFQETYVMSNGLLLNNQEIMNKLEKLGTLNVIISIDGPQDVHDDLRGKGTFRAAVEVLKELRKRDVCCSISSVIMRQTLESLYEIVNIATNLAIPVISLQPYQREISGLGKDHSSFEFNTEEEDIIRRQLANLLKYADSKNISIYTKNLMEWVPAYLARKIRPIPPNGCFVPSKRLVVDTTGDTYPCWMFRDRVKKKSMGNVYEKALSDIWHNDIHQELTMMALSRKCPGCLGACSDVDSYDAISRKSGLHRHIKSFIGRIFHRQVEVGRWHRLKF